MAVRKNDIPGFDTIQRILAQDDVHDMRRNSSEHSLVHLADGAVLKARSKFYLESVRHVGHYLQSEEGSNDKHPLITIGPKAVVNEFDESELWMLDENGVIHSAMNKWVMHMEASHVFGHKHLKLVPFKNDPSQIWKLSQIGTQMTISNQHSHTFLAVDEKYELVVHRYEDKANMHWKVHVFGQE